MKTMQIAAARPEGKAVMTSKEAAAYLGIGVDTLCRYAKDGAVPGFQLGGRWKFRQTLLDEWIRKQSLPGVTNAAAGKAVRA